MKNVTNHPILSILYHLTIFLECDIAQGMVFKGKRSEKIQNFTMDVDPGIRIHGEF